MTTTIPPDANGMPEDLGPIYDRYNIDRSWYIQMHHGFENETKEWRLQTAYNFIFMFEEMFGEACSSNQHQETATENLQRWFDDVMQFYGDEVKQIYEKVKNMDLTTRLDQTPESDASEIDRYSLLIANEDWRNQNGFEDCVLYLQISNVWREDAVISWRPYDDID